MCYGCYANGFQFVSHVADFRFAFFHRLVLGLELGWGTVRVKVYLLRLLRFYQAYCTLAVRYCVSYITGGV